MTHCSLHKKMSVVKIIQKCLCNLNKNKKENVLIEWILRS